MKEKTDAGKQLTLPSLLLLLLVAGTAVIYWRIVNVDPEGACKNWDNFSLCLDARLNYGDSFKVLPTDQEMIDRFNKHRGDFDEIKDKVSSQQGYYMYMHFAHSTKLRERTGVFDGSAFGNWPSTIYSADQIQVARDSRQAMELRVDITKYIAGAKKDWPHVSRVKGYVFFPLPAPKIENGHVVGYLNKEGRKISSWRVLDQLDGTWPEDWASGECLLRRIEPQWFLSLCRDDIGG